VGEYFNDTGRRQRDCPEMYLKTAIILTVFVAFYLLLVLVAATWWQALPLAILLGLSMAAIGFNIEHRRQPSKLIRNVPGLTGSWR